MTNPVTGQIQFPNNDTPVVNSAGFLTVAWYRFFLGIYKIIGGSAANSMTSVYTLYNSGTNVLSVYNASTSDLVSTITPSTGGPGGPVVAQTLGSSPFTFTASTKSGTLVVENGKVELSRDGGTNYFVTGLTGGTVPVSLNDKVRVTWFTTVKPKVTFFPIS